MLGGDKVAVLTALSEDGRGLTDGFEELDEPRAVMAAAYEDDMLVRAYRNVTAATGTKCKTGCSSIAFTSQKQDPSSCLSPSACLCSSQVAVCSSDVYVYF